MANVTGTDDSDFIHRADDDRTPPAGFNDIPGATTAADLIVPGLGDDIVFGDGGDDRLIVTAATDGADQTDLGDGADTVSVTDGDAEFRLTFTSAEVGNGSASDSNTLINQDGGLAVRFQAEDTDGALTGAISRYDDEGITFVASGGSRFDVRDLVSGVERGNLFRTATLGTMMADTFTGTREADYINAGQGSDALAGGLGNDFLVGGAGDDSLDGGDGDDSFIGGGGADTIVGGTGNDTFIYNLATDGADSVDLGVGADIATINAAAPTNFRLTFTSAEVGNGSASDSDTAEGQDGGLAVRLQAEDAAGVPLAATSRLDDEGITFVAGTGVTFDVRDLVSGAARGEEFEVVTLGTAAADTLTAVQAERPYYINAGLGRDDITGGNAADFLVGGGDSDVIRGGRGNDGILGGGGNDRIEGARGDDSLTGGTGRDAFVFNSGLDEAANIDLIIDFVRGDDTVELSDNVFRGLTEGDLADFRFKEISFRTQTDGVDRSDRILYEKDDGDLYFDRDGSGSRYDPVKFATVAAETDLRANDFLIV